MKRYYKNKRYIGIEDNFYKTWMGWPYNRYAVSGVVEMVPGLEQKIIPRGYTWRSQQRVICENPLDILDRGEEIISRECIQTH